MWTRHLTIGSAHGDGAAFADLNLSFRAGALTVVLDRSPERARTLLLTLGGYLPAKGRSIRTARRTRRSFGGPPAVALLTPFGTPDTSLTVEQCLVQPLAQCGVIVETSTFLEVANLCGLTRYLNKSASTLGPQGPWRIKVAQALLVGAAIVLVENPTHDMLSGPADEVMRFLSQVAHSGVAVIVTSQDPRLALHADRALLITDGSVCADLTHPSADSVATHWVHDTNPVPLLGPPPPAEPHDDETVPTTWFPLEVTAVRNHDEPHVLDEGDDDTPAPAQTHEGTDPDGQVDPREAEDPTGDHEADAVHSRHDAVSTQTGPIPRAAIPQRVSIVRTPIHSRTAISTTPSPHTEDVVSRAQRILSDLPGPVFTEE